MTVTADVDGHYSPVRERHFKYVGVVPVATCIVLGQILLPLYKIELHIVRLNVNVNVKIRFVWGVCYSFSLLALILVKVLSCLAMKVQLSLHVLWRRIQGVDVRLHSFLTLALD
jgi:hypothetical protein